MSLQWLMIDAGFKNEKELAEFFNVTTRTVRNWKKSKPPKSISICLDLMAGKLTPLHKNWKGFKIKKDCIESPEGDFLYHYEIRTLKYLYLAAGVDRSENCKALVRQRINNKRQPETVKSNIFCISTDQKK